MWQQKQLILGPKPRGFHLVTEEIIAQLPELSSYRMGLLHIFIQHTSASLTLNENADASVRADFEAFFTRQVPENPGYFQHTDEGSDDMPAHLKSSLLGCSVSIPIQQGQLMLGTWQGVYLCEHRNHGGARRLLLTLQGE